MPQTGWFLPNVIETEGVVTAPNSTWINLSSLTEDNPTKDLLTDTRTELSLAPDAETNFLIVRNFNSVEVPFGAIPTGIEFRFDVYGEPIPGNVQNVEPTELYLLVGNQIVGTNLASAYGGELRYGWSVGNGTDFIVSGVDYNDVLGTGFGLKFKLQNFSASYSYIAYIQQIELRVTYTMDTPRFYYQGSSTSEVNVTLDKSPLVTNPTTTFSVFHGDLDTTSSGDPLGYGWGTYIFDNSGDPTTVAAAGMDYILMDVIDNIGSVGELPYCCYEVTDHNVTYDPTNLVADTSSRIGYRLVNYRTPHPTLGSDYDTLYFNINVIDTTPIPQPPHFLYNGDTTSEVFVTLDLNPEVVNPTTTFTLVKGDDVTDGAAGYGFGVWFTEPQLNDPVANYSANPSPSIGGVYDSNYLSTPTITHSYGYDLVYETSNHTMTYNLTGLVAGQTYRRGLVLVDFNVFSFSGDHVYNDDYDILYFNIEVIDTSVTKKFRHTGTYNNFIF